MLARVCQGLRVTKHYPCPDFLSLHVLSDADLMLQSDAGLMSFTMRAPFGNAIARVRRAWVK
jgi:hypothetical protein